MSPLDLFSMANDSSRITVRLEYFIPESYDILHRANAQFPLELPYYLDSFHGVSPSIIIVTLLDRTTPFWYYQGKAWDY
jgi:hypothetical protein